MSKEKNNDGLLVPELGLANNKRNRRWLAIVTAISDHCSSQDEAEKMAWLAVQAYEKTS